jgi:hypothetical protein
MRGHHSIKESAMPLELRLPFLALGVIAGFAVVPVTAASAGPGARQIHAPAPGKPVVQGAVRAHHARHVMRQDGARAHHPVWRHPAETRLSRHGKGYIRALPYSVSLGGLPWLQPYGQGNQFVLVDRFVSEPRPPRRVRDVTELPVLIGIRPAPQSAPAVIIVR